MISEKRKKVTLITGFLGAGKTTFINALLKELSQERIHVIENELGKESLDHQFLTTYPEHIDVISHGCLCCSLNQSFLQLLKKLHQERDRYDHILIEATGIADPAPIVLPFTQKLNSFFNLQSIICVVDARTFAQLFASESVFKKQISFCDVVLFTKTENISFEALLSYSEKIQVKNPLAKIFYNHNREYPLQDILPVTSNPNQWYRKNEYSYIQNHKHTYDSISFNFSQSFNIEQLLVRLRTFMWFQSSKLYRLKAIVYDVKQQCKWEIHGVMKHLEVNKKILSPHDFTQPNIFVFIGCDLQSQGLEKMLKSCMLPLKLTKKHSLIS
ncbi:CobW family GTP-binding protein [Zhouia sp. PK063]|uniref:CobW family GTP-binding protein n=1 Tax=Zhouia sp. PK063 TaxID=3373602 RepID=UPI0037A9C076